MERLRRTMMFVPGANAAMLRDAPLFGADSVMFDLEDSVSLKEKDTSRALVHFALKTFDYSSVETVVRVNGLDSCGALDIEAVVLAGVNVIRLPKTETAQDIVDVEAVIERVERENGIEVGRTRMMAAIESAEGVLNAREIAKASKRLIGIALGAEDYVTNMKTRRYPDGQELFFARSMILHAARAAGIAAIDTVYSDVNNTEGFQNEVRMIKQLGFDGKSVINPRQIPLVNEIYTPTEKEIDHAKQVIWAIREAESKGSGVISLNGKMVDKPIVERAERVIALATAASVLSEEDI
ncbi:citrate lyase beta chain / citryl-CoA lyase subunit [Streptococcus dysgalactiae subsp. equisimilis]|uniref:Citrate lyase subunit beta n=1 Tax=Streptococcus dysgalactiae subsp. equisimilis AC-2713 TaxID=759913 RepID=A0AB33R6D2_STREQ|nr:MULTISPECIES: citrate (pro-3S)-lyase subunit beta [Streptococcus]KKC16545.1 citrate lyase subunit beta [Streptococcus dysgalactiae subsp. equisimilis]KKC22020.1 citrate lyase subunit beta [Streptococcus dysgalactiae subsp. equisimilis]MBM6541591.1 citrate (pro-3S)-lyase subunit beta [Streptococcus dysgalactiae subsp. equisimilis]MCY7234594.1 citrate (pro-3S)-lyase subunit beta [Streptococcus dysgalactiae]OBZ01561.1 citrate (pro-3S)-lyase subunit beta [Streptococcus dysgalactiae subsp. equis